MRLLWSECHGREEMSALHAQRSRLFYLKHLRCTVHRTMFLRFCLIFLFFRAWPDLCTFLCKLFTSLRSVLAFWSSLCLWQHSCEHILRRYLWETFKVKHTPHLYVFVLNRSVKGARPLRCCSICAPRDRGGPGCSSPGPSRLESLAKRGHNRAPEPRSQPGTSTGLQLWHLWELQRWGRCWDHGQAGAGRGWVLKWWFSWERDRFWLAWGVWLNVLANNRVFKLAAMN